MQETSLSLLDRVRNQSDQDSWQRLVELYTPMIRGWLRRHGKMDQDTDDLVQEVLAVVVRKVPQFRREPRTGAFRKWLRTITVNCLRDSWKSQRKRPVASGDSGFLEMLNQLEDPESSLSQIWEQEHDQHVTQQLLEMIRPEFAAKTWQAFRSVALDGKPAAEVAAELGLSINAVFIAKSRVLTRLRQEGRGLID